MKFSNYRKLATVVLLVIGFSVGLPYYFINHELTLQSAHQVTICEVFSYAIDQKICTEECGSKLCSHKCYDGYIDLIRHDGHTVVTNKILVLSDSKNKTDVLHQLGTNFPIGQLIKCNNPQYLAIESDTSRKVMSDYVEMKILITLFLLMIVLFSFLHCFLANRTKKNLQGDSKIYKRI
jgi:hypothetical protein